MPNSPGKAFGSGCNQSGDHALKSFFKWFQLTGYLDPTTVLPTAAVKFEKLGEPLPRHLSPEQMEAIYQVVTGDKDLNLRDRALLAVVTTPDADATHTARATQDRS